MFITEPYVILAAMSIVSVSATPNARITARAELPRQNPNDNLGCEYSIVSVRVHNLNWDVKSPLSIARAATTPQHYHDPAISCNAVNLAASVTSSQRAGTEQQYRHHTVCFAKRVSATRRLLGI